MLGAICRSRSPLGLVIPLDALPPLSAYRIANPRGAEAIEKSGRRCLCGERLRGHLKCGGCKALVGTYHTTTRLNRDGLCRSCAASKGRKERK